MGPKGQFVGFGDKGGSNVGGSQIYFINGFENTIFIPGGHVVWRLRIGQIHGGGI